VCEVAPKGVSKTSLVTPACVRYTEDTRRAARSPGCNDGAPTGGKGVGAKDACRHSAPTAKSRKGRLSDPAADAAEKLEADAHADADADEHGRQRHSQNGRQWDSQNGGAAFAQGESPAKRPAPPSLGNDPSANRVWQAGPAAAGAGDAVRIAPLFKRVYLLIQISKTVLRIYL
jgi:hypothetical protein